MWDSVPLGAAATTRRCTKKQKGTKAGIHIRLNVDSLLQRRKTLSPHKQETATAGSVFPSVRTPAYKLKQQPYATIRVLNKAVNPTISNVEEPLPHKF